MEINFNSVDDWRFWRLSLVLVSVYVLHTVVMMQVEKATWDIKIFYAVLNH